MNAKGAAGHDRNYINYGSLSLIIGYIAMVKKDCEYFSILSKIYRHPQHVLLTINKHVSVSNVQSVSCFHSTSKHDNNFDVDIDAVSCYVELHGFGYVDVSGSGWYTALALNGFVRMNSSSGEYLGRGFYTYIVDPINCNATDLHHFSTYDNSNGSFIITNYIHSLANGKSFLLEKIRYQRDFLRLSSRGDHPMH